ncbi:ArsR/SmtB family transcription factor [Kribbella deserti]|uniref:ArsR/SmtB family transcription factor n=1 Tax=Kribbella deserti TaxID=1926257 RepID=A0ABV6QL36_9ACTN
MSDAMDAELRIDAAEQFKALGHPLRHRLLFALGQEPATISQLAVALNTRKGNVAHHLGVLREAGMVRVVETRQVRGGTEQYYQRTARKLHFSPEGEKAAAGAILQAVAAELDHAPETLLLSLRNVRLTAVQAEALADRLQSIIDELPDAGPGESRYGLLATLYRPNQL